VALARVGISVGITALMVAVVIAITGGFVVDAGPLHLSAHRLLPSIVVAAAAYLLAFLQGRPCIVAADATLSAFVHRHALAIAIVLAAVAAGVGIAFGTYVVAASDPSAYISQAHLITKGDLAVAVPLASQVSWPMSEASFAPLGYRPGPHPAEIVPTYPPGLPFIMAIALFVAGENGPFFVGPFFAALSVLGAYGLAARLHSRTAGVIAAVLMSFSPLLLSQVVQSMSDIPATGLWTLALLAAMAGRPIVAGGLSGLAIATRPSLLPLAGVVALLLAIWSEGGGRAAFAALVKFALAVAPAVAALAWIQWSLYGDPRASGHGTFAEMFSMTNVVPNIRAYAMRVLTGETPALALITTSVVALVARRVVPAGLESKTGPTAAATEAPAALPSVCLAVLIAMPVLACYLAYGVFSDWAYLRFLLPIWPAAFAAAGALIGNASLRLSPAIRTQVLLVVLTLVSARNVVTAAHEGSFTLWVDASRYGTAGRYLDAVLPQNAVIVASQHSGSASYYTSRPVVRWDSLDVGFDVALDDLARLGRLPVIVVEDWEERLLRQKFPASTFARLDWPARADFGRTTRVRLFDPADRARPTGRPPDRLP
jgi:hypothetical protein